MNLLFPNVSIVGDVVEKDKKKKKREKTEINLPIKYASRITSVTEMTMALRAAHFQLQYL